MDQNPKPTIAEALRHGPLLSEDQLRYARELLNTDGVASVELYFDALITRHLNAVLPREPKPRRRTPRRA